MGVVEEEVVVVMAAVVKTLAMVAEATGGNL